MDKQELRKKYKKLRLELTEKDHQFFSRGIENNLLPLMANFNVVHTFLPIAKLKEFDTFKLIENPKLNHIQWFTSIVNELGGLEHVDVWPKMEYVLDSWSIPIPLTKKEADLPKVELVLVPLLCIDKNGNRIGYGKGYYDGFLSTLSPTTQFCGISFFDPIEESINTEAHDIPLHMCVTPNQIINFKN
ncbi:5-formyltetrahydrofolate cyclo-ligase [Luteibaculum oceani]|uniref:5-formyltetrahydrofolate cyclo-ligase n=1 Tax=Luteibaculum oceani TaxID=1294296 RepID=A0A5C6V0T4_9FLAO|nr:5-formyltetrahydrofolate cyclo-ligase [Luteibaculum oceani]TXC78554.1 5-formyltetrahydrofolate cyclo-ligase [Luteibaculum oceani]